MSDNQGSRLSLRSVLSPQKISGVYILIGLVVIFSIWVPDLFPTPATFLQVVNNNAFVALAALALLAPLATGSFDISVPFTMTFSGVIVAQLVSVQQMPLWSAVIVAMAGAALIGVVNGLIVVPGRVDALIATLATGFLIQAAITWTTGSRTISGPGLTGAFTAIAQTKILGVTLPVVYAVLIAAGLFFLLEKTATGRRMYATGFNVDAARLANVKTSRIRFGALLASAMIAGFAGIVLASSIGSGSPSVGSSYLLPAVAAVFLGATQFRPGRFNAQGTLLAVVLLGTGTTGLGLAGQPTWVQSVFSGVMLVAALLLQSLEVRMARRGRTLSRERETAPAVDTRPDTV